LQCAWFSCGSQYASRTASDVNHVNMLPRVQFCSWCLHCELNLVSQSVEPTPSLKLELAIDGASPFSLLPSFTPSCLFCRLLSSSLRPLCNQIAGTPRLDEASSTDWELLVLILLPPYVPPAPADAGDLTFNFSTDLSNPSPSSCAPQELPFIA